MIYTLAGMARGRQPSSRSTSAPVKHQANGTASAHRGTGSRAGGARPRQGRRRRWGSGPCAGRSTGSSRPGATRRHGPEAAPAAGSARSPFQPVDRCLARWELPLSTTQYRNRHSADHERISLAPLDCEQALRALLQVDSWSKPVQAEPDLAADAAEILLPALALTADQQPPPLEPPQSDFGAPHRSYATGERAGLMTTPRCRVWSSWVRARPSPPTSTAWAGDLGGSAPTVPASARLQVCLCLRWLPLPR
jgi:hypothetical protein